MAAKLDNLGYARVFRHPRTGELVVDTDSLRRPGGFAGAADFGADRYDDEDDFEDDDDFEDEDDEDDDEFEGDDFGDDVGDDVGDELGDLEGEDVGEIEGDDFGARGRRRRRRLKRRLGRLNRRESRVRRKLGQTRRRRKGRKSVMWGMTAVAGTTTLVVAGGVSVKMRLQHNFHAEDITFTGSAAGAKVTSIFFGDRVVWSSSDGIDVTVFGSTSFLRGLLKGQSLKGGLDITVNGTLIGPGDFAVTLVGKKPVNSRC